MGRSVSRLNRPWHWLLTRFAWWGLFFAALYAGGGLLLGWSTAYEVLVGITSPADAPRPLYGWVLSLAGWLLVPAFIGGVTGYLVNRQIDRRRQVAAEILLARMRDQASRTAPPTGGNGA
jgi:hypothetical protein